VSLLHPRRPPFNPLPNRRAKVELRGCLESPCAPSEPLSLRARYAIRRLPGEAAEHQPTHRQVDHGFAALREVFILITQAAIAPDPGDGAFDVSTIMLSSRHCLSRSYVMTYLLDDIRPPSSGVRCWLGALGGEPQIPALIACWPGAPLFQACKLNRIRPGDPPFALLMPAGLQPPTFAPLMQR
jgi:hypothetical protein